MTEANPSKSKKHYSESYFSNKLIDVKKEIERNEQVRECVGKVRVEKRVGK